MTRRQSRTVTATRAQYGAAHMTRNSPLVQLLVFVAVILVINLVAQLLGLPFRISVIGSIVASALVTLVMRGFYRR